MLINTLLIYESYTLSHCCSVAVSIASCDRSSLTSTKSHLRSTMGENRLSALAIQSIESDLVKSLSFGDIISEFALMKARRI